MQTDWLLVRRLAGELDRVMRGAPVRDAGRLADGRFGLKVPKGIVVIDAFGPTPAITYESGTGRELDRAAGWVRATATALVGLRVDRVRARRGDRLVAFDCSSRSRFGVSSGYRLVAELVPRFGNVLLLKDETIVSAAKEFTRAENARRAVTIGDAYEPPPLPETAPGHGDLALCMFEMAQTDDAAGAKSAADAATRALRARVPLVPRLAAESFVAESALAARAGADANRLAERCVSRAEDLTSATDGEPAAMGDIFCYWDGERLIAAYVIELAQFAHLRMTRELSLLEVFARYVGGASNDRAEKAFLARRASLEARVAKKRAALDGERRALERERDDAESRDDLRLAGEALYAHLDEVPPRATSFVPPSAPDRTIALDPELDAKANAAAIFKRYRKAVAKLEHTAKRLGDLEAEERHAAELAWELERVDADTLEDVAEGIERLERRPRIATKDRESRRKPLSIKIADDARIYVGRSPRGNADLTFRLARPDDLWFHVRSTPGAHVVLHIDTERDASAPELERAASLAAYHSKARGSEKVAVDYTERKFVRRQQNAPPGFVWYTNARTIVVIPEPEPALAVE